MVSAAGGATAVHVGWLGDSRAYWLGPSPVALTQDHSWALEAAAADLMSLEAALADPRAHTITRYLGADALDVVPTVLSYEFFEPGVVLVCSDGLWNYEPDAADLAARPEWTAPTLLQQSQALGNFALDAGGHDNITVVLGSLDGSAPAGMALGAGP